MIQIAVDLLKKGEPVIFPTETVYGLGAPLFNKEAINKIFTLKKRPKDNPLIVHVSSIEEALSITKNCPPSFFRLAERFWPGPLSLVLLRGDRVPGIVSAGLATLAVRMPSHPIALQLIRELGEPLVAPSANLSGRPSPTKAEDAKEDLGGKVSCIIDGGECSIGIESTVLNLSGSKPILLRPGTITKEEIEEVIQERVDVPEVGEVVLSPGMKYRHYAPKAKVCLVFSRDKLQGPFILSQKPQRGERLLSPKTLYAEFREADRMGISQIEIDCDPQLFQNVALMNRLKKAASHE